MPPGLWGLPSPTRDWTHILGSEGTESQPQDHQGVPRIHSSKRSHGTHGSVSNTDHTVHYTPSTHWSYNRKSVCTFWSPSSSRPSPLPTSVQFSSVAQSCLTLCDPMDCSTPGLPVHHQLPEFTQTHVHWVSDAIQPSHPLSSPFPPALNLSQHQGLFQWVSSSHQVAKVLELQLQHQSTIHILSALPLCTTVSATFFVLPASTAVFFFHDLQRRT